MQTCTEASLHTNEKDPPEKVGLSFVDVVCIEKKKSTSFRMCFYLAEQEGFELELWLTIIRNYQPLLTIFYGIPNILIPYSTTNNHHLVPP